MEKQHQGKCYNYATDTYPADHRQSANCWQTVGLCLSINLLVYLEAAVLHNYPAEPLSEALRKKPKQDSLLVEQT